MTMTASLGAVRSFPRMLHAPDDSYKVAAFSASRIASSNDSMKTTGKEADEDWNS